MREFLEQEKPKSAVVAGSGYIGLEVADALSRRGIEVTVLSSSEHLLEGFAAGNSGESGGSARRPRRSRKNEMPRHANHRLGDSDALHIHHGSSSETADIAVLATGLVPRTSLAESAGITVGSTGRNCRRRPHANQPQQHLRRRRLRRDAASCERQAGIFSAGNHGEQNGPRRGRKRSGRACALRRHRGNSRHQVFRARSGAHRLKRQRSAGRRASIRTPSPFIRTLAQSILADTP